MKKNRILFLGYKKNQTQLIKFLKKDFHVHEYGNKLLTKSILNYDYKLIISFGYNKIIKKSILKFVNCPIYNIHISYLPYNKGAHPNFWSFIDRTPNGVSIHKINENIDEGNIIFRKKIKFKNLKKHTFRSTYKDLILNAEKLFMKEFKNILNFKFKTIRTKSFGSIHYKRDLPKNLKSWDVNIIKFLKKNNYLI